MDGLRTNRRTLVGGRSEVELAIDLDRRRMFVLPSVGWVSTTYDFIEFAQVGDKRISLFNMMAKSSDLRICPFAGGRVRPLAILCSCCSMGYAIA